MCTFSATDAAAARACLNAFHASTLLAACMSLSTPSSSDSGSPSGTILKPLPTLCAFPLLLNIYYSSVVHPASLLARPLFLDSRFSLSYPLPSPPTTIPTNQIGFPKSDVVVATAVGAGLASMVCGIFGNLPFGLAPGTGLSAYLSYGLVLAGVLTRPQAMTVCFLSGLALGICALAQLSTVIMRVIPRAVKLATVVGMGLLIALIGMVSIRLVVPNEDTLVTLGDFGDYHIWLALVGLVVTGT